MSAGGRGRESEGPLLYCEIDGLAVPLIAEDLNLAGLFVQTTSPAPLDQQLEIFLRSSIGAISVQGHVVQVVDCERASAEHRRPGFGLLFTGLSNDQRAFLGLTLDAIWRLQRARPQPVPLAPAPKVTEREAKLALLHGQAEQVASQLRAELASLQGKTPWTTLGLEPDASIERAKEAFLEHSKRCHPHRYARHDSREVSRLATELFIAYKRSYSVITKLAPRGDGGGVHVPQPSRRTMTSIIPASSATSVPPKARTSARPRSR
jgi:hypothetical protein